MAKRTHVLKALALYSLQLKSKRHVVGFGVVPVEGGTGSDLALAVYVSKKLPKRELAESDVMPTSVTVPMRSKPVEVPVRVIEQGEVKPERL